MLEAADDEPESDPARLELLAVVRGLEALDQPSRVTLVTPSRYVTRGLRFGLDEWRENGWQWERFGEMQRVKNCDLWQRIDRAMRYHRIDCRDWRFDMAEDGPPASHLKPRHTPPATSRDRELHSVSTEAKGSTSPRGVFAACRLMLRGILQRYRTGAGCRPAADLQAA